MLKQEGWPLSQAFRVYFVIIWNMPTNIATIKEKCRPFYLVKRSGGAGKKRHDLPADRWENWSSKRNKGFSLLSRKVCCFDRGLIKDSGSHDGIAVRKRKNTTCPRNHLAKHVLVSTAGSSTGMVWKRIFRYRPLLLQIGNYIGWDWLPPVGVSGSVDDLPGYDAAADGGRVLGDRPDCLVKIYCRQVFRGQPRLAYFQDGTLYLRYATFSSHMRNSACYQGPFLYKNDGRSTPVYEDHYRTCKTPVTIGIVEGIRSIFIGIWEFRGLNITFLTGFNFVLFQQFLRSRTNYATRNCSLGSLVKC